MSDKQFHQNTEFKVFIIANNQLKNDHENVQYDLECYIGGTGNHKDHISHI